MNHWWEDGNLRVNHNADFKIGDRVWVASTSIEDNFPIGESAIVLSMSDNVAQVKMEYSDAKYNIPIKQLQPIIDLSKLTPDMGQSLSLSKIVGGIISSASYNGLNDIVAEWQYLPADAYGYVKYPDYQSSEYSEEVQHQLQIFWMIICLVFGNYGTSPRYGWIEPKCVPSFRIFCQLFEDDNSI